MKKIIKEFKEFIDRGSVVDLAIGVVIGSAFGKIVTSLVNDIIMPIIGVILGGIDFTNLTLHFRDATITYGNFLQNIIDFLIVSFCIFIFVKAINSLTRNRKETKGKKVTKTNEEVLLEEIRDLLKKKTK